MSELGNKRVFANNLQRLMDERNIDRRELCAAINTPYTTVCDWLNAKTYPRIDKIEQMSKYFSVKKSALTEMNADTSVELTEKQLRLLNALNSYTDKQQDEIIAFVENFK